MDKFPDPDRFQKVASGVQSSLLSIALVVGGGWTLYVFNSQLQVENARAQLAKLNRDLTESPRLELDISVQPLKFSKASDHRYFECRLTVKNVGTKSTTLNFEDKAVRLYRVAIDDHGQSSWSLAQATNIPVDDKAATRLSALVAQTGATNFASWAMEINEPGLYVLSISAKRSASEDAEAIAAGAPKGRGIWSAEHYFVAD
jgi:hypothetical protein